MFTGPIKVDWLIHMQELQTVKLICGSFDLETDTF